MNIKPLIIVTGAQGTGKTEFCDRASRILGYDVKNVGDILNKKLAEIEIHVHKRHEIGRTFFEYFSFQDYIALLVEHSESGVILDGVRLSEVVHSLRSIHSKLIHIHRSKNEEDLSDGQEFKDGFDNKAKLGINNSDYHIKRVYPIDSLDNVINEKLGFLVSDTVLI